MFEVGNLATGVVTSVSTERFDLIDNDIIDAADITEWLSLAATTNAYSSRYLRGDTDLDHDVDTVDLTGMIMHYTGATGSGTTWLTGDIDGDGAIDCADSNCAIDPACFGSGGESDCADGVDNDGNGWFDWRHFSHRLRAIAGTPAPGALRFYSCQPARNGCSFRTRPQPWNA